MKVKLDSSQRMVESGVLKRGKAAIAQLCKAESGLAAQLSLEQWQMSFEDVGRFLMMRQPHVVGSALTRGSAHNGLDVGPDHNI